MTNEYTPTDLWPVEWTCDVSTESATATGLAVRYATETLWAFTGRRFGLTTVTLRPCRDWKRETPYPDGWLPWPGNQPPPLGATSGSAGAGWYFLTGCGSCDTGCGCSNYGTEVTLPAPVSDVVTVKVDGSPLVTGSYRVDSHRILVRTDGYMWPTTNNLRLADTQVGTWSVTARFGEGLPTGAAPAVGELACQFLKAMRGDEDCRLPGNITSLARQGVSISMPDIGQQFSSGLTGLYLCDLFIATWNPKHLRGRAQTYSVDRPPARFTT